MEIRTDLRLTLKSSCDACTSSKVKCSGEDPCSRCVKKGISCFYSPKKKRGPVKKRERSTLVTNEPLIVRAHTNKGDLTAQSNSSLGSHERRSWSVFFTLYKHYAVSCSLFWFNRQLHKMRQYLLKQNKTDALKRLSSWMEALNIDEEELAGKVEACSLKIRAWGKEEQAKADAHKPIDWNNAARLLNRGSGPFHLRVDGELTPKPSSNPFVGFEVDESMPYLKISVDYTRPSADSEVYANSQFEDFFGYGTKQIEKNLEESGGGFLPWAADVLSRILVQESDLLGFVQIIAIKFNSLGRPTEYPIVRNIPSVHVFNVHHKNSDSTGPVQCVIRCTHRETISDHESRLDVFMSFAPLQTFAPTTASTPLVLDRDLARINDSVELPPKRVKKEDHHGATPSEGHQVSSQDTPDPFFKFPEESEQDKSLIYNFRLAQQEMGSPSDDGSTIMNHPIMHAESKPPQAPVEAAFDHAVPFTPEPFQEQEGSCDFVAQDKVLDGNSSPGVVSPNANMFGSEDDILESLPFVDSSDEESYSVNADDGEWLDELLNWTGPAIPVSGNPSHE